MIALVAATFASSLVGSVHCIAMCGPLVGLSGGASSFRLALVHGLGRLVTYVTLGVTAAIAGRALDLAGHLGSVQRGATLVAGVAILAWGLWSLATARSLAAPGNGRLFSRGLVQIRSRRVTLRAWLVGVLTGLLPCGWLWAFVVSAGGTADPLAGAAVMTAFWLGTLPAMIGMLAVAGPLIARIRDRIPAIGASVLVVLGLVTLATRWRDAGEAQVSHPHCHCHDEAGG
jgi:sulfite exporter TauE/SafE